MLCRYEFWGGLLVAGIYFFVSLRGLWFALEGWKTDLQRVVRSKIDDPNLSVTTTLARVGDRIAPILTCLFDGLESYTCCTWGRTTNHISYSPSAFTLSSATNTQRDTFIFLPLGYGP